MALFLLSVLIFAFSVVHRQKQNQAQTPQDFFISSQDIQTTPTPSPSPKTNLEVENIFQKDIPNLEGNWAIVIKDLNTQKTYAYNQDKIFVSASLYKLAVMWAVFQEIENGKVQYENVDDLLEAMITVSDNPSAIALAESIGWGKIDRLMAQEGMEDFNLTTDDGPFVNAKTIETLLERIYKKTAVSKDASERMSDLLFAQEINNRIPALLPKDTKVGHKTGEIDNFRHDVGIVQGIKSDYLFIFMSQSVPEKAAETIAQLSQQIYASLEK